jgi:hypothetical protein
MARNLIKPDARPVTLPGTFPPMPAVARILSRHDRGKLAAFVTVAIDLLDVLDGDPDREGECSEDEVSRCTDLGRPVPGDGPGCDIADAGENAWIEWQTMRGSQKRGSNITQAHEDAEDDDPAGQYDEDYYTGPAMPDRSAGCPISDPGEYEDGF